MSRGYRVREGSAFGLCCTWNAPGKALGASMRAPSSTWDGSWSAVARTQASRRSPRSGLAATSTERAVSGRRRLRPCSSELLWQQRCCLEAFPAHHRKVLRSRRARLAACLTTGWSCSRRHPVASFASRCSQATRLALQRIPRQRRQPTARSDPGRPAMPSSVPSPRRSRPCKRPVAPSKSALQAPRHPSPRHPSPRHPSPRLVAGTSGSSLS